MPRSHIERFSEPATASSALRRIGMAVALVLACALLLWLGPRNSLGLAVPSSRAQAPQDIAALAQWIAQSESRFSNIKPGNAKGIVWAGTAGQRTPWAVVYIHGFSASRMETAPLAETVAQTLGANVFYTRLTGHGLADGAAMGAATAQDWMADTLEAVRIGQTLGERVLLISCSTGSTLATWLGLSADAASVAAQVFISPNFGPKDKRAEIVNLPFGQHIARLVQGPSRTWIPQSEAEAQAWTSSYPTQAIFPMMALVKHIRESDLSLFQTPVLVLFSEQDQTVEPNETRAAFARLGSVHKSLEVVTYSKAEGQHVLAGAIKDPAAVSPMAQSIVQWLKALPTDSN